MIQSTGRGIDDPHASMLLIDSRVVFPTASSLSLLALARTAETNLLRTYKISSLAELT